MHYINKRFLTNFSLVLFILIVYFYIYWEEYKRLIQNEELHINSFLNKVLLKNDKNIFFLETSCALKEANFVPDGLHLTIRQACAIYSTAKMNPSRPVILYHSCPLHPNFYESSGEAVSQILKLDNVYIMNVKYEDILRGTLVENLITSKKILGSNHLIEHSSDVLRILLLYRYGGAYVDLDFVTMKSFDSLPKNMLTLEEPRLLPLMLSSGFMQFKQNGSGNEFLEQVLTDLSKHFSQTVWTGNAGLLLNTNFLGFCLSQGVAVTRNDRVISKDLCDISLIKSTTFYPVNYYSRHKLFDGNKTNSLSDRLKDSIAVHFWNSATKNEFEKVKIGDGTIYEVVARQYCPAVIENAGKWF